MGMVRYKNLQHGLQRGTDHRVLSACHSILNGIFSLLIFFQFCSTLIGQFTGAMKWGHTCHPHTGVWPFQVGPEMAKHPVSPGFRLDLKWPNTLCLLVLGLT